MRINNRTTWCGVSIASPCLGHSFAARAVSLIALGLLAHFFLQVADTEAAVPGWCAVGGHAGYCNNHSETLYGTNDLMLLDSVTFRRKTGNGSHRTVTRNECTEGANALANNQARAVQVQCRNSTVSLEADVKSAPAKFCESNGKLGKGLMSFDMTPGDSCPGAKYAICRELRPDGNAEPKPICWACRKRYREQKKKDRLAANFRFSQTDAFVAWANETIARRRTVKAVRLPGIGDMYSATFVGKVRSIVQTNPMMRFWFYTRSWAVPNIWEELKKLKAMPNLTMWLSWDRRMAEHHGPPPDPDLPWCWLAIDDDDLPAEPVDLVWRNDGHLQWNQSLPEKHVLGGSLVCPHEDGVTKTTCLQCGICWRNAEFRAAKSAKLLEKHQPLAKG